MSSSVYAIFVAETCRGNDPETWSDLDELHGGHGRPEGYTHDPVEAKGWCDRFNAERKAMGMDMTCCVVYAYYVEIVPISEAEKAWDARLADWG